MYVDPQGPCVFDYVTQRNLARELGVREYWNGESLSQQGCAPLLQAKYRSYSQACLILFCLALIFQVANKNNIPLEILMSQLL